ncbi:MAG TPA: hypothetical protein EYH45_02850 [Candidatus Caldiarchaeum subterraneum]|uniref:Exosome complex component Csl4 n=1 Tax=Caldiarchaeum subterraneum TaxID=311458 RepID=A0A832ZV32_CALS0|nr:hypothetical protein [Candidatus Caldarchaeum subterraneum]
MNNEKIVVPGEPVCVIEEFTPKTGVVINSNGSVSSIYVGKPLFDFKRREVSITPVKNVETIRKGDYVVAEVKHVHERVAIASILGKIPTGPLKYPRTAVVLSRREKSIEDALGVGDILVGLVINTKNGMVTVDISPYNCGVLLSKCNTCGRILVKKVKELYCQRCRKTEKRKTLIDYGNTNKLLNYVGFAK